MVVCDGDNNPQKKLTSRHVVTSRAPFFLVTKSSQAGRVIRISYPAQRLTEPPAAKRTTANGMPMAMHWQC